MSFSPKLLPPTLKQLWVCSPAMLMKLAAGMTLGFTSCFLKATKEPQSDIQMDIHTATWFVSSVAISMFIGYFIGSFWMSRFGRRKALLITSAPGSVGQLIMFFAEDVPSLMVGRVLTGISVGGSALIAVVVAGEHASPQNRPVFLNMATASMNLGSLIVHITGHYISWRALALITTAPFIMCLIVAYMSPESPSWLAERKQDERSREAFYLLRGRTEDSTREIEELIRAQRHKTVDKTFGESVKDFFLKFRKRNFLYPLMISFFAAGLMEASGRHIFPSYANQLIQEIISGGLNSFYYNIVLDVSITLSGFAAAFMVRVMKMRTLLFSTGIATVAVLALACLSLYLVKSGVIPEDYSMITLVLFALFFIVSNTGCTCIPLSLCGEIYPLEHRAVAILAFSGMVAVLMTFFLKIMPYMVGAWHVHGAFGVLCACVVAMLAVLYCTLPETKGRTLQEIEDYFTGGRFRDATAVPGDDDEHEPINISNKYV